MNRVGSFSAVVEYFSHSSVALSAGTYASCSVAKRTVRFSGCRVCSREVATGGEERRLMVESLEVFDEGEEVEEVGFGDERASKRSSEMASERIMQPPRQIDSTEAKSMSHRISASMVARRCRPCRKEARKAA